MVICCGRTPGHPKIVGIWNCMCSSASLRRFIYLLIVRSFFAARCDGWEGVITAAGHQLLEHRTCASHTRSAFPICRSTYAVILYQKRIVH